MIENKWENNKEIDKEWNWNYWTLTRECPLNDDYKFEPFKSSQENWGHNLWTIPRISGKHKLLIHLKKICPFFLKSIEIDNKNYSKIWFICAR